MKKAGISTAMLSAALALTLAVGGCGSNKNAAPAAPAEPAPAPEAPAEEAPEASFPGISGLDLFDYFECSIEDIASAFPDLEYDDSYKTNTESSTTFSEPTDGMETLSDGLALAGPFFSVDNEGTVVGIYYGGKNQTICGLCGGMDMKEAGEIAKSHGFEFSRLDVAHGTAAYVAIYNNGEMELAISSDAEGDISKTEESDITGNVDSVSLYLPDKI